MRAAADEGEEASNARGAQRDIKNFFAPVGAEGNVAVDEGGGNVAVDDGRGGVAIENGSSRGVGSSAVAPGLHPHRVPLELAEARETRRGWTSAPPPPPLESDPRVTSQLTDPPTAPPTQDARTTSTLTEPNDAVTVTETTAMTAVERVMERMEREFERRRGKATEGHAPVGTGNMPPPPSVPSVPSAPARVPPPSVDRAGDTSETPRVGTSPTQPTPGSTLGRGGGWGRRRRRRDGMGWDARHAGHPGRRVGRVGRHAAVSRSHLGAGGAEADGADADGAEADGAEADATSVARGGFGRLGRDATRA